MRLRKIADLATTLLTPPTTTRASALTRMERTSAVTHLMSSLEHLANRRERRHGGMNDWTVTSGSSSIQSRAGKRALNIIAHPVVTDATHVARVAAAAALHIPGIPRGGRIAANAVLAGSSLALHPRHHYGTDGSDQVSFLVQSAALVARTAGERTKIVDSVLWTVALQSTLSYAISGWAKLAGQTWREGRALPGVTRTLTYGDRTTWELTQRFPRLAKAMGASVLALECSFPLTYLCGGRLAKGYVAGSSAFHLGVARIMALGRFVPSFTSMHGPVEYTVRRRASTIGDAGGARDDAMPRLAGGAFLAVAASALTLGVRNRRIVQRGRGDEQRFTAPSGNSLAYRTMGAAQGQGPVYVLEAGMLATPEHWEWIARDLATHGTVVTYSRAGYGPSTWRRGTAQSLDDLTADLVGLCTHVAQDREVVLVGHSLGGYLAMKAAVDLPVATVALVDSSHPDEMRRSKRQELGADALTAGIGLTLHSMRFGAALLVARPEWVDTVPESAQQTIFAQFRDARLWKAARREWEAVREEFDTEPHVPEITSRVLSLSAGRTVAEDPIQGQLHRELADRGSSGSHQVIAGADHDSILTQREYAAEVARRIEEYVATHRGSEEQVA